MQDKVCVITGGFGFLGRNVAEAAAQKGYKVAMVDLNTSPATELPDILKNALLMGGIDISSLDEARKAASRITEHFGRVDVILNIAGGFRWETVEEGQPESWETLYKMNVMTCLNMTRALLPLLKKSNSGSIVNVGAAAALKASLGMGAYAASKSAVHRLTESLAEELKDHNITVNAVLPSIIDTPLNRTDMPDEDFTKWVQPQDLAEIMLFLASDRAASITGALLPVTGRC